MDFSWKTDYEIGVKEFDGQHKVLIGLASEVHELLSVSEENQDEDMYDDIMSVLERLYEYTEEHFDEEEQRFEASDYAKVEEHKLEHEYFKKQLTKLINRDIDEDQYKNINDLLEMLTKWFIHHILKTDMEYVPFITK